MGASWSRWMEFQCFKSLALKCQQQVQLAITSGRASLARLYTKKMDAEVVRYVNSAIFVHQGRRGGANNSRSKSGTSHDQLILMRWPMPPHVFTVQQWPRTPAFQ